MNAKAFGNLLTRVNLGGHIEEAVVRVSEGVAEVEAIDLATAVYVKTAEPIGETAWEELGFGRLSLMAQYLSDSEGDVAFKLTDSAATLRRKAGGQVTVPLLAPKEVPTMVVKEGLKELILDGTPHVLVLTEELLKRLEYHNNLASGEVLCFTLSPKGRVTVANGETEQVRYDAPFGDAAPAPAEAFSLEVLAKNFFKVCKVLQWTDAPAPELRFGPGGQIPIAITQGEDAFWAITLLKK